MCVLTQDQAASIPEGQNELKRNQLRELAALNGTLRDDENQACQNCGQIGHRKYDCPEKQNFTANIICRVCGNAGHMARDCPDRQKGASWRNDGPPSRSGGRIGGGDAVDREYEVSSLLPCPRGRKRRTQLTRRSNSCKSSVAVPAPLPVSKLAPAHSTMAVARRSPGSGDLLALLLLGDLETTTRATMRVVAALHLGAAVTAAMATEAPTTTMVVARATMVVRRPPAVLPAVLPALLLGTRPPNSPPTRPILSIPATARRPAWVPRPAWVLPLVRPLALPRWGHLLDCIKAT